MRKQLRNIDGQRKEFTGHFERYGVKPGWKGVPKDTILLTDIRDENNKIVTNHLWFNRTKGFDSLGELKYGDKIKFHARVTLYTKGHFGRNEYVFKYLDYDYKLSHPTKIKKL
jgi:hypothetical protein